MRNGNAFLLREKGSNFALKAKGWLFKNEKFRTKSECEKGSCRGFVEKKKF